MALAGQSVGVVIGSLVSVAGTLTLTYRSWRCLIRLLFAAKDWEHSADMSAREQASLLKARFPQIVIDPVKGDASVQERLDELMAMGAPEIILNAHRNYFGKVIFVSIADESWNGASVNSYLHTMSPRLGDVVYFDLDGNAEPLAAEAIANDLADALGLDRHTANDDVDVEEEDEEDEIE